MAREWNLIALVIARSTGRRLGIDTSTRMAMNAFFATDSEPSSHHKSRLHSELEALHKLTRILTKKAFRIQFIGTAPDRRRPILKEVEIQGLTCHPQSSSQQNSLGRLRRPGCEPSIMQAARFLSDTRPIADRHRHQGANETARRNRPEL
jgi:hypothetical protein